MISGIELCEVNDLELVYEKLGKSTHYKKSEHIFYYDDIITFDIETSSFRNDEDEKNVIVYIWQLCANGSCFYSRSFSLFFDLISGLNERAEKKNRFIIWVHNLSYEFMFIYQYLKWDKVFCIDSRRPVFARSDRVVFRCSYVYSNKSLAKIGDELNVRKTTENMNYDLIRTPLTPLSDDELEYCLRDVFILHQYIANEIEIFGNITKLELTNTGKTRTLFRNGTINGKRARRWRALIKKLTISDVEMYRSLKRAFAGGFTHANAAYVGKTLENVTSFDFKSAYPYVMCAREFPMSLHQKKDEMSWEEYLTTSKYFLMIADFEFFNLISCASDDFLSKSKFIEIDGEIANNGRVHSCDHGKISLTSVDMDVVSRAYQYDRVTIRNVYVFEKAYLPKEYVEIVLDLFRKKTEYDGIPENVVEYALSKIHINSAYGMMVMDIVKELMYFDIRKNEWLEKEDRPILTDDEIENIITKYNESDKRFLFYPWGVFVTAYCRAMIFEIILHAGSRHVYSDTDSDKLFLDDEMKKFIDDFNEDNKQKLYEVCDFYGISRDITHPRGKQLGKFEYEETYRRFKTLGAKRYLVETADGKFKLTCAGLDKKKGCEYIVEHGDFNFFNDNMKIDKEHSGRKIHSYIDHEMCGVVRDYQGIPYVFKQHGGIHLDNAEYNMSLSADFTTYLSGILLGYDTVGF